MQNSTTILGIIEMRLKGISYDDCCNRYSVGHSTVNLIMARYKEKGVPLEVLKQLPDTEIEASFSPPSNVRRKSKNIMPDFEQLPWQKVGNSNFANEQGDGSYISLSFSNAGT